MWEKQHENYFEWDGETLVASLIHYIPERDNHPDERYGVQIYTSDGSLFVIGYIPVENFDSVLAQAIADSALAKNQSYEWWDANSLKWWTENVTQVTVGV